MAYIDPVTGKIVGADMSVKLPTYWVHNPDGSTTKKEAGKPDVTEGGSGGSVFGDTFGTDGLESIQATAGGLKRGVESLFKPFNVGASDAGRPSDNARPTEATRSAGHASAARARRGGGDIHMRSKSKAMY